MRKYIALLLALVLLCGCAPSSESGRATRTVYRTTADALLAPQEVNIGVLEPDAEIERLFAIVNELQISEYCDGVKLVSFEFSGDALILRLSEEYGALTGLARTLCDGAITLTFCELNTVNTVVLCYGGAEYPMMRDTFLLALPTHGSQQEVKLYFTKGGALAEEVRTFPYRTEEEFLRAVAEALLSGPRSTAFISPIPTGTRLNAISEKDGVCTVDVSSEFLALPSHTEEEESLCLFALINTVAQASNTKQVRVLIDGESIPGFTHYDLTQAIQPELFD